MIIDLIGDHDDGLRTPSEQLHDVLIGGSCPHGGIHDKENGIGEVDGDFSLKSDRLGNPFGIGFPTTGIHQGERRRVPVGPVGHSISRHTRGVLNDGFSAPQNTIHQRRLADVRAPHHCQHRQSRLRAILAILILETVEDVLILFVELVIREPLPEGLRPLLTLGLIKAGEAFC